MSDRKLLSDHLLLRWLERVEGHNLDVFRAAMERVGLDAESERELVHFIEVYTCIDLDAIREEMLPVVTKALARRADGIRYRGFYIPLRKGRVAISIMPRGKRRHREAA